MIISKLIRKAQTTIPQSVRTALRLKEGDAIAYRIGGDQVVMTRALDDFAQNSFAAFSEWASAADRRAYAKL